MDTEKLYFEIAEDLPPEWNSSSKLIGALQKELREQGIQAEIKWEANPLPVGQKRELVLAILAAGTASIMLAHAIKKVLDSIKPGENFVAYKREITPAVDKHGNAILDANDQPLMNVTETPVLLETAKTQDEISLKAFHVFEFRSSTGDKGKHGKTT